MVDPDQKKSFLSPALRAFFQRRLLELAGLLVILTGLALTAMFFSPGRFDPSLSAYSDGPVQNWFGPVGAGVTGALRTAVGTASLFVTLLPVFWGYRMLRKHDVSKKLVRLFLAPVGI
jgi:hypothetical protein